MPFCSLNVHVDESLFGLVSREFKGAFLFVFIFSGGGGVLPMRQTPYLGPV